MGRLLQREIEQLQSLLGDPARPFVAVLGGRATIEKAAVVLRLLNGADAVLMGEELALVFLAAQGQQIGAPSHGDPLRRGDRRGGHSVLVRSDGSL